MTPQEFSKKIKEKYPEYQNVDDTVLAQKMVAKYPEYQSKVSFQATSTAPTLPPQKSFLQKAAGVTDAIFGGGKVGELIGNQAAKGNLGTFVQKALVGRDLSPAEEKLVGAGPKAKQVLGSAAQAALTFAPVGKIATGLKALAPVAKLGATGKVASNVVAGGTAGYGYDVASGFANKETNPFEIGAGTVIGGGLPLAGPVAKLLGRGAGEVVGASTGTGFGSIKQALKATSQGGEQATAFREAMRGNTSPETIVDDAKSALGEVIKNRSNAYKAQLQTLVPNTKSFDVTPVISKFNKHLEDFGVTFKNGVPDFTRSPGLGRYEKDLTKMSAVIADWGSQQGDNTVVGIDKLKQVIDDFRINSADSRKFDSFVTSLRNEAKGLIKNEPGYDKLVKDYETSTGLIKDIQKGLSLGDKVQTDTAFRKLTSVLRTNNEFRKQLVDELDSATGGTLSSKIAGQQMSEVLPRGLVKTLGTVGAGAGVLTGVGIVPMLKVALLTSPRLVGEVLSAAGYSASKIDKIIKTIAPQGFKFPGDTVYDNFSGKNNITSPIPNRNIPTNLSANESVSNITQTLPPNTK